MIFIIIIIVKHENAGKCGYGSDGKKWHGKQDFQLSLSWGRPYPTDDDEMPPSYKVLCTKHSDDFKD